VGRDPQKLSDTAKDLKVRGAEAVETYEADLTDYTGHCEMISRFFACWNGLDAALVAHGMLPDQQGAENDINVLRASMEVNYLSVVTLLANLANFFEKQGSGVLAVIGSVAGDRGRKSNYVYGSAKSGVATFVEGLRMRMRAAGIHVVLIKPGWVSTPMTKHFTQNFLFISAERAGRDVFKAINSPRAVIYLPWYWKWIMRAVRVIPEFIFAKLNF
jgi:short-subunit dehydrogenase